MLSGRRTLTLLVVLCLGHVLLISAQVQTGQGRSVFHASAFGAMAAIQGASSSLTGGAGGIWSHYIGLIGVSRQNDELRARVLSLEGQLQAERARGATIAGLEQALKLQQTVVAPTLAARVIAGNPGSLTVTINRGAADGVMPNMAVIGGNGVVGRVIGTPTAGAAVVQLLNSKGANTGAMIEKNQSAGLAVGGFADGWFRLEMVSSAADVATGDLIVTSGQDGIYPPGFPIGRVHQINGTGKSREILVAPAVDFSRIDVVLVVLARPTPTAGDVKR
jgi:rod shape-determining protein MreC